MNTHPCDCLPRGVMKNVVYVGRTNTRMLHITPFITLILWGRLKERPYCKGQGHQSLRANLAERTTNLSQQAVALVLPPVYNSR